MYKFFDIDIQRTTQESNQELLVDYKILKISDIAFEVGIYTSADRVFKRFEMWILNAYVL